MAQQARAVTSAEPKQCRRVPAGTDLTEWYSRAGGTDGLPVVRRPEQGSTPLSKRWRNSAFRRMQGPRRAMAACREGAGDQYVMAGLQPEYASMVARRMRALTTGRLQT